MAPASKARVGLVAVAVGLSASIGGLAGFYLTIVTFRDPSTIETLGMRIFAAGLILCTGVAILIGAVVASAGVLVVVRDLAGRGGSNGPPNGEL